VRPGASETTGSPPVAAEQRGGESKADPAGQRESPLLAATADDAVERLVRLGLHARSIEGILRR